MTTTATAVQTCQAPGCTEPVSSMNPKARYCSRRCQKREANRRARASRPARERRKATTATSRRSRSDLVSRAIDAESFRRQLEQETRTSLARDPERWRPARAADPDEHRRRIRRSQP